MSNSVIGLSMNGHTPGERPARRRPFSLRCRRWGQPQLLGVQPGQLPLQHDVVDRAGVTQPDDRSALVGQQRAT